ncbi:MAG: DUF805 domain-containing protein [Nitriliruptoraceae bacterium]
MDSAARAPEAPAAWYRDPTGRHQYRYFDGRAWTAHVANDGVTATDALDAPPPPPPADAAPAGAEIQASHASASVGIATGDGPRPRGFLATIAHCLEHATDFRGRAPRAEYWWFALFRFLVLFVATNIGMRLGGESGAYQLALIVLIVLLVPYLAVSVRRLHDIGLRGWLMLLELVPFVGSVAVIVLMTVQSEPRANRFGPPITPASN